MVETELEKKDREENENKELWGNLNIGFSIGISIIIFILAIAYIALLEQKNPDKKYIKLSLQVFIVILFIGLVINYFLSEYEVSIIQDTGDVKIIKLFILMICMNIVSIVFGDNILNIGEQVLGIYTPIIYIVCLLFYILLLGLLLFLMFYFSNRQRTLRNLEENTDITDDRKVRIAEIRTQMVDDIYK